ncbi:hypothetical protein HDU85_002363 [Gaertneriomyces sp. JEL0708]|nr:hypothetical protein HDU85_002363 [Gaertneriomyces sp. JEL0708]
MAESDETRPLVSSTPDDERTGPSSGASRAEFTPKAVHKEDDVQTWMLWVLAIGIGVFAYLCVYPPLPSLQGRAIDPKLALKVNTTRAHQNLANAIRIPTLSGDTKALAAFRQFVRDTFPKASRVLEWEVVEECGLMGKWQGSRENDDEKLPALWIAHMDVVPVDAPGTWTVPPFDGSIVDGMLYGRGTLDDKSMLMAEMEAVEALLEMGYVPKRSLYVAFGCDEEIHGDEGAGKMSSLLQERGVKLEYVLDEGMPIAQQLFPGVSTPIAFVGVVEKSNPVFKITARAAGGHASLPFAPNPIHLLSRAIATLSTLTAPPGFTEVTQWLLDHISPEHPSAIVRRILRHPALVKLLLNVIPPERAPGLAALTRTTWTTTQMQSGVAANVMPGEASAIVNVRIRPGQTEAEILQFVARKIGAQIIQPGETPTLNNGLWIETVSHPRPNAHRLTRIDTNAWKTLTGTIRHVFGQTKEELLVSPSLLMAGTDSVHYAPLTDSIYRFQPVPMTSQDTARLHGIDERIGLKDYDKMIEFFMALKVNGDEN